MLKSLEEGWINFFQVRKKSFFLSGSHRRGIISTTGYGSSPKVLLASSSLVTGNSHLANIQSLGTLSKDVFERRASTGSEAFSLFICLDANKLVLLSFFSPLKTIYPRVSTKPLPNDAKSPLPVDFSRSKTLLLKLPIMKVIKPYLV